MADNAFSSRVRIIKKQEKQEKQEKYERLNLCPLLGYAPHLGLYAYQHGMQSVFHHVAVISGVVLLLWVPYWCSIVNMVGQGLGLTLAFLQGGSLKMAAVSAAAVSSPRPPSAP